MRLLLFALLVCFFTFSGVAQGLQFQGNDKLIEERTSYSVFANKVPSFKNNFTIEFDISILQFNSFGYIFRLKDEYTQQTYNLTYTYKDDKSSSFKFNTEGKNNLISIDIPNSLMGNRRWLPVSLSFMLKEHSLIISVNGEKHKIENIDFPKELYPRIYFGKNEHVVDVPVFAMRNMTVVGDSKKYNFPLKESIGEDVHDDKGDIIGHVSNPVWLINQAYYWKLRYEYKSNVVSGVNYDESKQDIIFFNSDSLTTFDLQTGLSSVKKYNNHLPVDMQLGTNFIDDLNGRLFVYEVNNLPIGSTTIAYIDDIDNPEWKGFSTKYLPMQLHHHDGFFDSKKNRYIIFGGFGNQRYNKEFLSYDIDSNKWDTLYFSGDKIMPRYFSGMASWKEKNQLYIYGGMGNESGDHTIGRSYLYDLYQVDLNKMQIKKLWDILWEKENIVPARNMVMLADTSFYALCYPEHKPSSILQLYQFSIKDGSFKILGDSIPIVSEKIPTNANLYYNLQLKEFYCTVQEFQDDGSSVTRLYSLSSPPISEEELSVYGSSNKGGEKWLWLLLIIPIFLFVYFLYRWNKKKDKEILVEKNQIPPSIYQKELEDKANAIYLFGDFTVYDRKGRNITYMFSTKLKQALLLILQYSSGDGIPSQVFSETLWPDKTEYSTKNLRNVTLSHLRKILMELQGIELLFDKGNLRLLMTEDCYCDYSNYIKSIYSEKSEDRIDGILNILPRGRFLKLINDDFFKEFTEKTENKILSLLPMDIENVYKQQNYNLALHISELLFITDPLNEKALYFQINSLYRLKLADDAKRKYTLFTIEYKKEKNKDFPYSFQSILKDTI